MVVNRRIYSAVMCAVLFAFSLMNASADNFPASKSPPDNLSPQSVPQFVNIGFDDNGFTDGMEWILDFLRDKTNPQGINNVATYDGTPARVVFYLTTCYGADTANIGLKESWIQAKEDGHEIGNHTVNHYEAMAGWNEAQWKAEMDSANRWMVDNLNIDIEEIWGFRTPFLAFNYDGSTHFAIKSSGMIYDCTLNAGSEIIGNGSDFYWPYTLDEGSPDEHYIKQVPGLWEIPTHHVMLTDGSRMTGFDYNLWVMLQLSKSGFVSALKNTLDLHYSGNRAPFTLGGHTDYYSEFNESANNECNSATWQERREAIEEFLDYALSKPDVRIVTTKDIIRWLRYPVALDETSVDNIAQKNVHKSLSIGLLSDRCIQIVVPEAGMYTVSLYAINGRKLIPISNLYFTPGQHLISWNSNTLACGVYYLRLQGSAGDAVQKVTLGSK